METKKVVFRYAVSDRVVKDQFKRLGIVLPKLQRQGFSAGELSPLTRKGIVDAGCDITCTTIDVRLCTYTVKKGECGGEFVAKDYEFDSLFPTQEEIEEAFVRSLGVKEELRSAFDNYNTEYQEEQKKLQADREAEAIKKEKHSAAKTAERQARKDEKIQWIIEHGSGHLLRAASAGYDCQRQYVTERALLEFPGFEVDFDDRARYKDRVFPSAGALDVVDRVSFGASARVVWLQHPVFECGYSDWNECEAVLIEGFLGEYDLIQEIPGS